MNHKIKNLLKQCEAILKRGSTNKYEYEKLRDEFISLFEKNIFEHTTKVKVLLALKEAETENKFYAIRYMKIELEKINFKRKTGYFFSRLLSMFIVFFSFSSIFVIYVVLKDFVKSESPIIFEYAKWVLGSISAVASVLTIINFLIKKFNNVPQL